MMDMGFDEVPRFAWSTSPSTNTIQDTWLFTRWSEGVERVGGLFTFIATHEFQPGRKMWVGYNDIAFITPLNEGARLLIRHMRLANALIQAK